MALLGSPDFYGRFGFRESTAYGVTSPDARWGGYFQVRTLSAHEPSMRGVFTYAEPFARL
ncbi:hypothetical protein [Streptomyces sp. JJ36]|uniref:hypothetical protein n=1 Tax=Streptomyces sp. JJ36 TaxID=2736645 RepID=UPI001F15DE5A|nr:hypothetical protein [Streptomyces sp. JJ36]MCF6525466.1 hypothetical protein [Streptomyces sp. JJ36]